MPRRSSASPVTERVRALLRVEDGRLVGGADGALRGRSPAARGPWGWVPDPPEQTGDETDAAQSEEAVPELDADTEPGTGRRGRHRPPAGPALVTTPSSLRQARVRVSWHAVVALILVLVVGALVFAVRVARAEQSATPSPVAGPTPAGVVGRSVPSAFAATPGSPVSGAPRGGGASPTGVASGGATSAGPASPAVIVVHVVGQVSRPGVVTLVPGARVVDAITLAGGTGPGADLQQVNLARPLVDGEQIYVPRTGESAPPSTAPMGTARPGSAAPGASGGAAAGGGLVNLNTADAAALDGLPGLGPVLAQRIVDWRSQHGRFTSVDELGEVSGIGEKLLSQIRSKVSV